MIQVSFKIPPNISTERANVIARKLMLNRRFQHKPHSYNIRPDNGPDRILIIQYQEITGPEVKPVLYQYQQEEVLHSEFIEAVIDYLNEAFNGQK